MQRSSGSSSTSAARKQRAQLAPAFSPARRRSALEAFAWRRPGGFLLSSSPQAGGATEEAPASLGERSEQRASSRLMRIETWAEAAWGVLARLHQRWHVWVTHAMAWRYRAIWGLLPTTNQWRGLHDRQDNHGVLVVRLRSADCARARRRCSRRQHPALLGSQQS